MARCFRCSGRKKMFKFGSGYTLADSGGVLVDCPLCSGTGLIPDQKEIEDIVAEQIKRDAVTNTVIKNEEIKSEIISDEIKIKKTNLENKDKKNSSTKSKKID